MDSPGRESFTDELDGRTHRDNHKHLDRLRKNRAANYYIWA